MSITIVVYYLLNGNVFMCLLVSVVMLLYAITSNVKVLDNKIAKFLSGISMEIYLCHMMVFRILQKMKIWKWMDSIFYYSNINFNRSDYICNYSQKSV